MIQLQEGILCHYLNLEIGQEEGKRPNSLGFTGYNDFENVECSVLTLLRK